MTPYKIYIKTLLEGTGFAFDEDEQNMGFRDTDEEGQEGSFGGFYEIEDNFETQDDTDRPTRGRRGAARVQPEEDYTVDDKNKATPRQTAERRNQAGNASLTGRLVDLAISVYNAYEERGLASYDSVERPVYRLMEMLEMGAPSREELVSTLETIGMAMNAEGIDLRGADVGTFTADMLSEMYFLSIPNSKLSYDTVIPDETGLKYIARKIDEHIKGTRVDANPVMSATVPTYRRLSRGFASKDKTVSSKREVGTGFSGTLNTDTSNANVTHVEHVPSGRAFYFTPHSVFEKVKTALGREKALADSYNLDDLTAEYLFLGQTAFKKKYKFAPVDPLDLKMKSRDTSLASPCYGSIGPGGEIRFGKNFRDILAVTELQFCRRGKGGIVKDSRGNPLPGVGERLMDALEGAKGKTGGLQVSSKELSDAITGEYMYHTKFTGTVPLFDYFTTNTLMVSTSGAPAGDTGEEMSDDRGDIASRQDEYMQNRSEDTESGNVILQTIDDNMWNKLGSEPSRKVISALGVEQPDPKLDDETNMTRVTAVLTGISKLFENAGARSRITTYDGVHPVVEIDDSERGTSDSITVAWSNALKPVGGMRKAITGVFAKGDICGMVNAMLDWTESFAGKFQEGLEDTLEKLSIAGTLDEAIDDITPDIDIDLVIGQYIEDTGSTKPEDAVAVAEYTLNYVIARSREIMCPFLENMRAMMDLLGYIDAKMDDDDPYADVHYSYTDRCALMLARLVKWNVLLDNKGNIRMDSISLIPPTHEQLSDDVAEGGAVSPYTGGQPLLDSTKPAEIFQWVRTKVTRGNPREAILLLMGMLDYARDMKAEEADADTGSSYLDAGETRIMSLRTAYDKYGKNNLLRMIGAVCDDSGDAVLTLWKVINSRTPVDDTQELGKIGESARKLADINGIRFKIKVDRPSDAG